MDPNLDLSLVSFVESAQDSPFPIQNLPFGVFQPPGEKPRVGVAIGDQVLDLARLEHRKLLPPLKEGAGSVFAASSLNAFLALGRQGWRAAREQISQLLRDETPTMRDDAELRHSALHQQSKVRMLLPVEIGDYTDFYSSRDHAFRVGSMFRGPENALPANWLHLPIAYHGRASSVIVSGRAVHRPCGQKLQPGVDRPVFGPSEKVDFELEMGLIIGTGNALGEPISVEQALDHVFGMVLVNDWSARDIQRWEYQPLGPFLSKSFATSISPWVVTLDALAPLMVEGPQQNPFPLPYLHDAANLTYNIQLEVYLATAKTAQPARICFSNYRHLYWSPRQQIAHHTINGCNLRTGDLLATGTISGPEPESCGCLLELTCGGKEPLTLPGGEKRSFLEDGDRVTMTGFGERDGLRIGFGEVKGQLLEARI